MILGVREPALQNPAKFRGCTITWCVKQKSQQVRWLALQAPLKWHLANIPNENALSVRRQRIGDPGINTEAILNHFQCLPC